MSGHCKIKDSKPIATKELPLSTTNYFDPNFPVS